MRTLFCMLFIVLSCGNFARATTALDVSASTVSFLATGKPGLLKIRGESADGVSGNVKLEQKFVVGNFFFDLGSLKTGIALRDDHMKNKYLEIGKYPRAELKFSIAMTAAELDKRAAGSVDGELTLHGVTRKTKVNYVYNPVANKVDADFDFKISDFGIQVPSYLGVTVSENVAVTMGLTMTRK